MPTINVSIPLTLSATGNVFDLETHYIYSVIATGSGSTINWYDEQQSLRQLIVNESPSAVSSAATNLILVTNDATAVTLYVNPDYIYDVIDRPDSGTGCVINMGFDSQATRPFTVTETRATVRGLINAVTDTGEYVTLATNQTITGQKTFTKPNIYAGLTGVTAHAGGGQGSATPLTGEYNNVTVVASANDSVLLITPVLGSRQVVTNKGASVLAVYGTTGVNIDGLGANNPALVDVGATVTFYGVSATVINSTEGDVVTVTSNQTVSGVKTFSAPLVYSINGSVTAAGTTQGAATALTSEFSNITTTSAGAVGVVLPAAVVGLAYNIKNNSSTLYSALVFPAGTNTIAGGSSGAPVSIPPGGAARFVAVSSTDWEMQAGSRIVTQQITLTNAQVLTLNGSPIPVAKATGIANEVILPISATMAYTRGSASYTANTELDLIHSGSTNACLKTSIAAAASTFAPFISAVSATPSGNVFIANADLNLFVPTGNPTGGDAGSSIKVTVTYAVMAAI